MRILVFGNNWVAWQIVAWLRERDENLVGLALHPNSNRKCGDEIIESANLDPSLLIDGSKLAQPEVIQAIKDLKPDIGLSLLFDYIFAPELIEIFKSGIVNLHPAYLPYNRGQYPNVWSIVEGTPSGVTLHYIDARIDTGDIISQVAVEVEPIDTGLTLYRKLEQASVELFAQSWPAIRSGQAPRLRQQPGAGTYHRRRAVEKIDEINLNEKYLAKDLIDILRARTFPPYEGAYFLDGDRKVFLSLQLSYEDKPDERK